MYERLLTVLRCPECGGRFELVSLGDGAADVATGLLRCDAARHAFPVVGGTPRLLPDALTEHWADIQGPLHDVDPELARRLRPEGARAPGRVDDAALQARTRASFGEEWAHQELGGRTWGMEVDERVRVFFLDPLGIAPEHLGGKVVLDAGCGAGSQSVAYTALGLEVIAVDISDGVDEGQAYRPLCPGARPERVHFVQGDLRRPPLAPGSVDVIHAVGVLHHTPDTHETFRALRPLLRDGGTFYVWLYRREPYVTAVMNAIRAVTTRLSPGVFARVADAMAWPFIAFRAITTALGVRGYPPASRSEAAFALIDTFGSPYRHHHSFVEVAGWYRAAGFESVWRCNEGRRGFGACGRLPQRAEASVGPARASAGGAI